MYRAGSAVTTPLRAVVAGGGGDLFHRPLLLRLLPLALLSREKIHLLQ
jgi:hypothetical protein